MDYPHFLQPQGHCISLVKKLSSEIICEVVVDKEGVIFGTDNHFPLSLKIGYMLHKQDFPDIIRTPRTVIRRAMRGDFSQIWKWPLYEWPWEVFNRTDRKRKSDETLLWWEQIDAPNRCHYTAILADSNDVIGIYVFSNIDWQNATDLRRKVGHKKPCIRAIFQQKCQVMQFKKYFWAWQLIWCN